MNKFLDSADLLNKKPEKLFSRQGCAESGVVVSQDIYYSVTTLGTLVTSVIAETFFFFSNLGTKGN